MPEPTITQQEVLDAPQTADGQVIRLLQTVYRADTGTRGYTEHVVTCIRDTWMGWCIGMRDGVCLPPNWLYSTKAAALAAANPESVNPHAQKHQEQR